MNNDFNKFVKLSTKIHQLEGISRHLDWDAETYMPEGGAENRAEQLKTLAGIIHKEKTGSKYRNALSKLINIKTGEILAKDLSSREQKAILRWRTDYLKNTSLPTKFVEDFTKLTASAIPVWREARKQNNFKLFAPWLKKIVAANRKKAEYLKYAASPYDALLDLFEPGMTVAILDPLFQEIKENNIQLVKRIQEKGAVDDSCLLGNYPEQDQLEVSKKLLNQIGYDLKHGRLDLSTHPFSSSSHPTDSRITTRVHLNNVFQNISTVLHEAGHSLYEMGLPEKDFGTPLGESISMGIHESQSRFWETRIGLSKPFWSYFLPILQEKFPLLNQLDLDRCVEAVNKVSPSFIRVEADEITYPLHVILRYELEKGLIEGSIKVDDIPRLWNDKMGAFLGITPPNDTLGCLQDIHWAMGAFGYFPTYLLGNLFASEIFESFRQEFPDWERRVARGDFGFIKEYLHKNVYRYGREFESLELIEKLTGHPFSSKPYIQLMSEKFTPEKRESQLTFQS